MLVGSLLSVANNDIPITGIVSGKLGEVKNILNNTTLNFSQGTVGLISEISGYIFNPIENVNEYTHVLDIKNYNTLGRKGLALQNPLLGYDLHKTSNNLDDKNQYAVEYWKIIEYSTDYSINDNNLNEELIENKQFKPKLATPTFLKAEHIAAVNYSTDITNELPSDITNELPAEMFLPRYCGYLNNNIITIKKYSYNDFIENDSSLLFGPILTLDECNLIINNYADINNCNIIKINDYKFMVTTNGDEI